MADYKGNFYSINSKNYVKNINIYGRGSGTYFASYTDETEGSLVIDTGIIMNEPDLYYGILNNSLIVQITRDDEVLSGFKTSLDWNENNLVSIIITNNASKYTVTSGDKIMYMFISTPPMD